MDKPEKSFGGQTKKDDEYIDMNMNDTIIQIAEHQKGLRKARIVLLSIIKNNPEMRDMYQQDMHYVCNLLEGIAGKGEVE